MAKKGCEMTYFAPDVSVPGQAILDTAMRAQASVRERIAQQPKWEEYAHNTERLEVVGGHIFRVGGYGGLVFVPDVGCAWNGPRKL